MLSSNTLQGLVRKLDRFSEICGRTLSWLTLAMVVVTFLIVIMRYIFNVGNIAIQESVIYMHSMVFMLGAAYTLKHDGHVRVDIFYRPLSERNKAWVNLFGTLLLLLPTLSFIFYISWQYVASSWHEFEGSQEAGGLPFRYLLKSVLLAMPALMILQGIAELGRSILILQGKAHLLEQHEEHAL